MHNILHVPIFFSKISQFLPSSHKKRGHVKERDDDLKLNYDLLLLLLLLFLSILLTKRKGNSHK